MEGMPLSVEWRDGRLLLLDQRKLPHEEAVLACETIDQVFESIRTLAVRGAPAIGIAAAYGLLLGMRDAPVSGFARAFDRRCDYLIGARPTGVNLSRAVNRMRRCARAGHQAADVYDRLLAEAKAIHEEDRRACHAIAAAGCHLVARHPNLLTHCNAGSLATSELGTALAPVYRAQRQGVKPHVFVDETRPLLQGARLTAYELMRNKVACTLIADNMAAHLMSGGRVDMVLVGADRIAANGDTANKIGTLGLAILCRHFSIPFYVAAPLTTVDISTPSGKHIVIEERAPAEVKALAGQSVAPDAVAALSPAFDVTPGELITGIVTDAGLLEPPFPQSMAEAVRG